ncbi:MAG: HD domain-containing protein [Bacteroidota bacterium]
MDRKTRAANNWQKEWTTRGFCISVTGSVARKEETPFSDIDFLILHTGDQDYAFLAEQIVSTLSVGVDHASIAVRSIQDISSMLTTDIRSWVAQMDAVFIAGNAEVFCLFRKIVREGVISNKSSIIGALESLTADRYSHYGYAVTLLEPNVKNSAGTLRDVHTIYYLGLLDVLQDIPVCTDPWPEVHAVLNQLSLISERRQALGEAYGFLLLVRSAMHELSQHLHDSLDFELQRSVAEKLGFGEKDSRKGVEHFMHAYYKHTRAVNVSLRLVFYDQKLKEGMAAETEETRIGIPPLSDSLNDVDIMLLFLDMAQRKLYPGGDFIRAIDHGRGIKFGKEAVRIFDLVLREKQHVADTLQLMHEMGVLGVILPEFAALEHFFQHNVYHFFTADEHTLRAIHACETSLRENEHSAKILAEIKDLSVLYYSILLHDIAKPVDLQRHEHVGADMAPEVLRRFDRMEISDTVVFLVREHLSMEQLAFRRNIREVTMLQPFIKRVKTVERLNLLYILTLADMSALNPGVLTDWKRELLRELYETVRQVLLKGAMALDQMQQEIEDTSPESAMSEAEYGAAIQDVIDGQRVRINLQHHRAYSEVTVFCLDRPQLLAQFSAALFGADCSIVDASIDTHNDVVIDTFRVVDIFSGKHLRSDQSVMLKQMVQSVCAGELDAEQLFERYRRKWVRKLRKLPKKNVTVDVTYVPHRSTEGGEQTIVEVYAPDTFGLLYKLASAISRFGLNVVFAKIATRVDGVVDSFYVVDNEGKAFTDSQRQQELKQRLLEQITALTQ